MGARDGERQRATIPAWDAIRPVQIPIPVSADCSLPASVHFLLLTLVTALEQGATEAHLFPRHPLISDQDNAYSSLLILEIGKDS